MLFLSLAFGGLLAGTAAQADPVNVSQLNQERRIDAGVRSGKLTRAEAQRLRRQQAAIRRDKGYLRASMAASFTAHDERLIHARQDAANAAILWQKHDPQRANNYLKIG